MNKGIFYFSRVFVITSFIFCVMLVTQAVAKKNIKFQINLDKNHESYAELVELSTEIESDIGKSINSRSYWAKEASRSFSELLDSYGYYNNKIVVDKPDSDDGLIIFKIKPGQQYILFSIVIKHAKNSNEQIILPDIAQFKLKKPIARRILEVQNEILEFIEEKNCLFSLEISHKATINHLDKTLQLKYIVDAGPNAVLGETKFEGLKRVKEGYTRKLLKLKAGKCFKRSFLQEARTKYQKTGLFYSVKPVAKSIDKNGVVPVTLKMKERKPRSLKFGIEYGSNFGLGGKFGWEHRNSFGAGEKTRASVLYNKKEKALDLDFVKPYFRRKGQKLILGFMNKYEEFKAFKNREISLKAIIARKLTKKWRIGAGLRLLQLKIKKKNKAKSKYFSLLSLPFFIEHDTRDDILNPLRGYRVTLQNEIYFPTKFNNDPFLKSQISASRYFSLTNNKNKYKPVFALKVASGSIFASETIHIPQSEMFYSGGSSSLRGYGHQFGGQFDSDNIPIGGKSFVEFAAEIRSNITKDFGAVVFVDWGFAYQTKKPMIKKKILYGSRPAL